MDNIRYFAITPKNQKDNLFEEIYTKAGYILIFERLLLESTSADKISIRFIDNKEYEDKIKEYMSRGGVDIKEINESTYNHRRQRLEDIVQVN